MMNRSVRSVLATALLLFAGCEEDSTSTPYTLCTPSLEKAASPDQTQVSTAGGPLTLTGRNFWLYFSGKLSECDAETPTPAAEPGDEEVSSTPYGIPEEIVVYVGSQPATVVNAYERSVPTWIPVEVKGDDGSSTTKYQRSDCDTCRTCISCTDYGCGGCDAACLGCEQVIQILVPALLPSAGVPDEDAGTLTAPVRVLTGIKTSNEVFYSFLSACEDGLDNDGNDLIDDEDPSCLASGGWSEQPACGDGLDNDGDGWIDAELDPGCGGDEAGFSELDACADGLDNDEDGLADLLDPDCGDDATGQSEESSQAAPACANGRDDDLDGATDHGDPRCTSGFDDDESAL